MPLNQNRCYKLANPFSPYSIQKRPEPQICPKFVPTIVFRGSNQGDQNLSKICRKFVENLKICLEIVVFQIFDKFLTNFGPPDWNPEKQSLGQILDKFGIRGVFECCKGKKGFATINQLHSIMRWNRPQSCVTQWRSTLKQHTICNMQSSQIIHRYIKDTCGVRHHDSRDSHDKKEKNNLWKINQWGKDTNFDPWPNEDIHCFSRTKVH